MIILSQNDHSYTFERNWAHLPRGWALGDANRPGPPQTSVQGATAANGDIYVLCRSTHPVLIFNQDGSFITSWGEGRFSSFVHGLTIDPAGKIWITDTGLHTVTQHEPDGTPIQTFGTEHVASPTFYGAPFNMPTGTAFTSDGDVFVSDGYGNRRVHRFSPQGELRHSWGGPGDGPGEFALVHFIGTDAKDQIYICDRENNRIQLFSPSGETLAVWTGFTLPSDIAFGKNAIYVAGADGVSIWTYDRRKLAHFAPDDPHKGAFNVHGIWLDADENIYLAQFDRAVSKLTRR